MTFLVSNLLISYLPNGLWWKLSAIISCGTAAGALIPEIVKVFTSTNSKHVREVVNSSKEGGASLNILSGLVAGIFPPTGWWSYRFPDGDGLLDFHAWGGALMSTIH